MIPFQMDLSEFESQLGVKFNDKNLLTQSLIHRSYLNENPKIGLDHNERLEFLGDAVLELAVTDYLYKNYPHPEGELTAWRAALVNAKTLAKIADELNFNQYILLSRGEAKDTGKARQVILANAFEAFLGALYLDKGYEESVAFIGKYILPILPAIIREQSYKDAKSLFQEIAQDKRGVTPKYSVLKEWGPDHAKTFRMGVFLGDELAGEGEGVSKQDAEQDAAKDALMKLGWG